MESTSRSFGLPGSHVSDVIEVEVLARPRFARPVSGPSKNAQPPPPPPPPRRRSSRKPVPTDFYSPELEELLENQKKQQIRQQKKEQTSHPDPAMLLMTVSSANLCVSTNDDAGTAALRHRSKTLDDSKHQSSSPSSTTTSPADKTPSLAEPSSSDAGKKCESTSKVDTPSTASTTSSSGPPTQKKKKKKKRRRVRVIPAALRVKPRTKSSKAKQKETEQNNAGAKTAPDRPLNASKAAAIESGSSDFQHARGESNELLEADKTGSSPGLLGDHYTDNTDALEAPIVAVSDEANKKRLTSRSSRKKRKSIAALADGLASTDVDESEQKSSGNSEMDHESHDSHLLTSPTTTKKRTKRGTRDGFNAEKPRRQLLKSSAGKDKSNVKSRMARKRKITVKGDEETEVEKALSKSESGNSVTANEREQQRRRTMPEQSALGQPLINEDASPDTEEEKQRTSSPSTCLVASRDEMENDSRLGNRGTSRAMPKKRSKRAGKPLRSSSRSSAGNGKPDVKPSKARKRKDTTNGKEAREVKQDVVESSECKESDIVSPTNDRVQKKRRSPTVHSRTDEAATTVDATDGDSVRERRDSELELAKQSDIRADKPKKQKKIGFKNKIGKLVRPPKTGAKKKKSTMNSRISTKGKEDSSDDEEFVFEEDETDPDGDHLPEPKPADSVKLKRAGNAARETSNGPDAASQQKVRKKKYYDCGACLACSITSNCGKCAPCRDLPEFGGHGTLGKKCVLRTCIKPKIRSASAWTRKKKAVDATSKDTSAPTVDKQMETTLAIDHFSEVESLSDNASLAVDDLDDLDWSETYAEAAARRPLSFYTATNVFGTSKARNLHPDVVKPRGIGSTSEVRQSTIGAMAQSSSTGMQHCASQPIPADAPATRKVSMHSQAEETRPIETAAELARKVRQQDRMRQLDYDEVEDDDEWENDDLAPPPPPVDFY